MASITRLSYPVRSSGYGFGIFSRIGKFACFSHSSTGLTTQKVDTQFKEVYQVNASLTQGEKKLLKMRPFCL